MLSDFLDPEKLHHAYVVTTASFFHAKDSIEKFVSEKMKLLFHGNPDVFVGEYATIGIDDLAEIVSMHQRVPIGPKKIIILITNGITMQAQNSILKMIEEPTPNTHFFFAMPTAASLLPTVLSRVQVVDISNETSELNKKDPAIDTRVKTFLSSAPAERLDIVKGLMADFDKERTTKEEIFQFVSEVVKTAHDKKPTEDTLAVISRITDYLRDASSSLKMLLEYLSLRL